MRHIIRDISRGKVFFFVLCVLVVLGFGASLTAQDQQEPAPEGVDGSDQMISTYLINPLDRLLIMVYAGERQQYRIEKYIQSDGTIYLEFLEEDVDVGGLLILEAQKKIEVLARKVIITPRVVITVLSSYSQTVSTYGKIANRNLQLNAPTRVLQLIAQAGGPMADALEDSIRVISRDGSIRYFDYKKVNKHPNNEDNFFLKAGDIVFVPGVEDFSIIVFGEVRSSGVYDMRRGDRLIDALVKAGSWNSQADIENVRLIRVRKGRQYSVLHSDLKKVFNEGEARLNYELKDGDMIYIPVNKSPMVLQYWTTVMNFVQSIIYVITLSQAMRQ